MRPTPRRAKSGSVYIARIRAASVAGSSASGARETMLSSPPYKVTVCYPEEARPAEGCVSVLSPVGASLLGLRVGETARWCSAAGRPGVARILSVLFQPEAHAQEGA